MIAQLANALRLNSDALLALVGASGKTSVLARTGWEIAAQKSTAGGRVWMSVTTHLGQDQLSLFPQHVQINDRRDLLNFFEHDLPGAVLLSGPAAENEKVSGLAMPLMDELKEKAGSLHIPLVIEADGSKKRPLKAPAEHEPLIPPWANQVVVVAGLSALGKPNSEDWVHRPERFTALCGLAPGALISKEALLQVLCHPLGGLKNIPSYARRVLLLNQAGTAERQAAGKWLADRLCGHYHAVVIANIIPPLGDGEIFAVHEKTAGVVLAAGASTRMGSPKQLLKWRGQSLVHHAAALALAAGLDPVLVVTGCESEQVSGAVQDLPVTLVNNPRWQTGQSASIVQAIHSLPAETGAAVFLLADQPLIPVELVRGLASTHAETLASIIAPVVNGERSNPVLFDRRTFADLSQLTGDRGGRALFSSYNPTWFTWHGELTNFDVDTPEDYQRLLALE